MSDNNNNAITTPVEGSDQPNTGSHTNTNSGAETEIFEEMLLEGLAAAGRVFYTRMKQNLHSNAQTVSAPPAIEHSTSED